MGRGASHTPLDIQPFGCEKETFKDKQSLLSRRHLCASSVSPRFAFPLDFWAGSSQAPGILLRKHSSAASWQVLQRQEKQDKFEVWVGVLQLLPGPRGNTEK